MAPAAMQVRWTTTHPFGGAGAADRVTASINETPLIASTTAPARNRCNGSQEVRPITAANAAATTKPSETRTVMRLCLRQPNPIRGAPTTR